MKSDNVKTLEDGGDFFTRNSADDEIQTVFKTGLDLYKKAFGKKGHSAALTEIKIPATYLRLTADLIRKADYAEVLRMTEEATDMIEQGIPNNGRLYPAMVNAHLLLGQWEEAKAIMDRLSDLPYPLETYKNYKEAFKASIQYWSKGDLDTTLLDQALGYLEN